jgi:hypothetical protein
MQSLINLFFSIFYVAETDEAAESDCSVISQLHASAQFHIKHRSTDTLDIRNLLLRQVSAP